MSEENMEVNTNILIPRTVYELLGEKFYIPAYQRGYRWSPLQVEELLDDVWEFCQRKIDGFYCLQPVVVRKQDQQWELIDGQQRLTTLFIILSYFNLRFTEEFRSPLFSIEYATRPTSLSYLKNINEDGKNNNIDFYHMYGALEAVKTWFKDRQNFAEDIKSMILNRVKVIWYEIAENIDPIDVFTRLNIGKIPLTNSELIKALFLQSSNFQQEKASLKQIQIATEWDLIEKSLQESSFWYFIYNPDSDKKYDTRIEYIFDMMKEKPSDAENFYTFHKFNADFKGGSNEARHIMIERLWKEVKDYYLRLDEWYRDRELYHLIGFLVACGRSVNELKANVDPKNKTKTDFKSYLKKAIKAQVNCRLDNLNYGDVELRKVLLLFNIQTLLASQEADIRFPFDRYKNERWDIEHIRSQTDQDISGKQRIAWSKDLLEYFTGMDDHEKFIFESDVDGEQDIVNRLCQVLSNPQKIDDKNFDELYGIVAAKFKEAAVDWTDGIGNLALLDAKTNRGYKNAMFPIKRKTIIKNDMNGVFVPICTKNAFMKFYSKKLGEVMYWQEADARDYMAAIKHVLREYLPSQDTAP